MPTSTDVVTLPFANRGLVSNASPIDRSIAGPLAYKYMCLPRVVATLAPAEVGRIFSATRDPMTFLPHHALHFTEFCVAYCHNLPNKRTIPGAFPSSSLFAPMPGNFMFSHGCMFGSNVPSLSAPLPLPLPLPLSMLPVDLFSDDMACSTQQQTQTQTQTQERSKGSSKKRSRANALADPIKIPRVKRPRPCARIDTIDTTMELDNNTTMHETQEQHQNDDDPPQISVFKTLVLLMQPCLPV